MKCKKCDGYGIIGKSVPDILSGKGAIFVDIECDQCNGTGEYEPFDADVELDKLDKANDIKTTT